MRESKIEKYLVDTVKRAGGIAYKFKSPGRANVPDRMVLMDGLDAVKVYVEHMDHLLEQDIEPKEFTEHLLACFIQFVELKATGEKPSEAQIREHDRLRAMGFHVHVIDSHAGVDAFVKRMI